MTDLEKDGQWLSITELAKRKGVGKSTVSEKVKQLVEAGRLATKHGPGSVKLVSVEQYEMGYRGNLIVADIEQAANRITDVLTLAASELTVIAFKDGENGMRAALGRIARHMCAEIIAAAGRHSLASARNELSINSEKET